MNPIRHIAVSPPEPHCAAAALAVPADQARASHRKAIHTAA